MKKKILISGSCGFIYSNFIRKIIFEGNNEAKKSGIYNPSDNPWEIISVDKIADSSNVLGSVYLNKNHQFYLADITDQHVMDRIFQFEKPDIIIHGAAESFVDKSMTNPNIFVNSNILGTQVLLNCAVKHGTEKFIYASTDEVYGQLESENDPAWSEEIPCNPRNPYAATKMSGELLVKAAHFASGLNYTITRSSNNYGPRQNAEKFIPKIIKCILRGEKIPLYGAGKQMRDWVHVFDHCAAIMTILKNGGNNEIYNIGAGQEFSNLEVIQKICNVMGSGYDLIEHVHDPRGNAHDFRYAVDSKKIRSLDWKPNFKFKDGIENTVEWYKANQNQLFSSSGN